MVSLLISFAEMQCYTHVLHADIALDSLSLPRPFNSAGKLQVGTFKAGFKSKLAMHVYGLVHFI